MNMTGDLGFSPSAWRRGGVAYHEAGADLVTAVEAGLARLDVEALGSGRGEHLVDAALALVVPAVKQAFEAACRDLAEQMSGVGEAMVDTAGEYQRLEQAQADLAHRITQEL